LRAGSGGQGKFQGGDGVIREIEFLKDNTEIGILSERRTLAPYGMAGGESGLQGKNLVVYPDGRVQNFGAKNSIKVPKHSRIVIQTPGGGGYGKKDI